MKIKKTQCTECVKEDVCGIKKQLNQCYEIIEDLMAKGSRNWEEIIINITCTKYKQNQNQIWRARTPQ